VVATGASPWKLDGYPSFARGRHDIWSAYWTNPVGSAGSRLRRVAAQAARPPRFWRLAVPVASDLLKATVMLPSFISRV